MAPCLIWRFFCDELLQGFDMGICIAQRLGYGFLLGFGGGRENRILWKTIFETILVAVIPAFLSRYALLFSNK
jgi:hypothetical protein